MKAEIQKQQDIYGAWEYLRYLMGGRIHNLLVRGQAKKEMKESLLAKMKLREMQSSDDEEDSANNSSVQDHNTSLHSRRSEYRQSSRPSERKSIRKFGLGGTPTPGNEEQLSRQYRKGIDDINAEAAKGTAKGDCEGCQIF